MKTSLVIAAACLLLGSGVASAQSQDAGNAAPQEDGSPQQDYGNSGGGGVSPREAWRQYMMKRQGMEQGAAQQGGQARHGGGHGGPAGMGGRGPMGGPAQGARFVFDRNNGRIFIQCAPADSTEACARAVVPVIESVMGSSAGEAKTQ